MNLETKRLIMRKFNENDFFDLYEYLSDEEVVKYEPYKVMDKESVKEELNYRINSDEFLAVELKENHKVIGNLYLSKQECESYEIGYVFNKKYWKHGYATEASLKLLEYLFSSDTHRVFSMCDPLNENSWKLLERLTFTRSAYIKKNVYFFKDELGNPIWKDTFIYSLLKEDYEKHKEVINK